MSVCLSVCLFLCLCLSVCLSCIFRQIIITSINYTQIREKQIIPSPDIQRGLFGLAVENIGDIDQDGYEDVAISAPYVDDGHGVVYIFRGSSDGLITDDYQVSTICN